MKKYIVLVVTTLILTGLAGCSMTKNRYNHYGVVKYLENKYDDKFEYYETYGGTLFDSDSWKKFICTSEKYPGKHILVIYDVNHDAYHDNYFEIKYAHQVDGLIDSMLSELFGDDPYYFRHYEGADVSGLVSQYDADTTFEEYIAEENLSLTAFIKSDKSNGWIDLYFVENFDEKLMHDSSYKSDVIVKKQRLRHYSARMENNRKFTESYWED